MYRAWLEAEKQDYKYIVWLNDDTFLYPEALKMMIQVSSSLKDSAIIVGASKDPINDKITSFGADFNKVKLFPNGNIQECDAFGGNFVVIPQSVYKILGKLEIHFTDIV